MSASESKLGRERSNQRGLHVHSGQNSRIEAMDCKDTCKKSRARGFRVEMVRGRSLSRIGDEGEI